VGFERVKLIEPEFDEVFAERKYDLSFRYAIEVGGTCDVSAFKKRGLLAIEDYKNGRTVVEANNNFQMKVYGLGAYHNENEWYDFKKVRTTIIQPNAPHRLGRIRSDEFKISELLRWEEKEMAPAIELIAKNTATLIPGPEQCTWCDGRHLCEANAKQSVQLAQIDFQHLAEPKAELPAPNVLTREQLCFILDNDSRIRKFLDACAEHITRVIAETDERVGDYELIDKVGNRTFIESKKLRTNIRKNKLTIKECMNTHEPSMMTVTQLEAYLKNAKKWDTQAVSEFMGTITERPLRGKMLSKSVDNAEDDFSKKPKKLKKSKTRSKRK
jgi:hypothetical protein